jgi:hypothetical protein
VALVVRPDREPHLHGRRRPGPVRGGGRRRERRTEPQLRLADHRGFGVLPERLAGVHERQAAVDPARVRVRSPERRMRDHRRLRLSRRHDHRADRALLLLRLLCRLHPEPSPRREPGGGERRPERAERRARTVLRRRRGRELTRSPRAGRSTASRRCDRAGAATPRPGHCPSAAAHPVGAASGASEPHLAGRV